MTHQSNMQPVSYPHLQAFLSGWFHQDFDIVGDSIEAIAIEFKRVSSASDTRAVAADIREFLSASERQVDDRFTQEFDVDIDPTAFAPNVKAFLTNIATHLECK